MQGTEISPTLTLVGGIGLALHGGDKWWKALGFWPGGGGGEEGKEGLDHDKSGEGAEEGVDGLVGFSFLFWGSVIMWCMAAWASVRKWQKAGISIGWVRRPQRMVCHLNRNLEEAGRVWVWGFVH
jgi:hypothetical protein